MKNLTILEEKKQIIINEEISFEELTEFVIANELTDYTIVMVHTIPIIINPVYPCIPVPTYPNIPWTFPQYPSYPNDYPIIIS